MTNEENNNEDVEFNLDESNELLFKLSIVGQQNQEDKLKVRLVCENKDLSNVGYIFNGETLHDNNVKFTIPSMVNKIKPGNYDTRLEVVLGSKLMVPLTLTTKFKEPLKVVVESVTVKNNEDSLSNTQKSKPLTGTPLSNNNKKEETLVASASLIAAKPAKKESFGLDKSISKIEDLIKAGKIKPVNKR